MPEIAQRKDEIGKLIQDFYDKIKDRIEMNSFVADFAVVGTEVYLIELNSFGPTASPSLFDWKIDTDVMHNGTILNELWSEHQYNDSIIGPFEFRVVMQPYQNGKSLIARPLRHLMAEFRSDWQDKPQEDTMNQNTKEKKEKKECIVQ